MPHVVTDGVPLVPGKLQTAASGEQCCRSPAVSLEFPVSVDVADVMQKRGYDQAFVRNAAVMLSCKSQCLQAMVRQPSGIRVVTVTADAEEVAAFDERYYILYSFPSCCAQEAYDGFSSIHVLPIILPVHNF